jgi:RimJ/RimL family protein N-acetyltransferase
VTLDIRRLDAGDEALLRATRLRALADAPAAFGTTLAAAQARDDEFWTNQVAGRLGSAPCATWVVVDADGDGVGMLTGVNTGDAVDVIQVWVAPDHRGTGLVERLFAHLFEWSPHERIGIAVEAVNDRARRVYERVGFQVVGERPGVQGVEIELTQRRSVVGA